MTDKEAAGRLLLGGVFEANLSVLPVNSLEEWKGSILPEIGDIFKS